MENHLVPEAQIKIHSKFPLIDISKIRKDPQNVKKHPEGQVLKLMDLIRRDGFDRPVAINSRYELKAGHGRLLAAERLGMKKVPYRDISYLSAEEQQKYMIEDNLINESPWEVDHLKAVLEKMDDPDFGDYFEKMLKKITPDFFRTDIEEDEPPTPRQTTAIKRGEVYQMGRHKIMCGDSTVKEDVDRLLGRVTVDEVVTDPPYGVDYSEKTEYLKNHNPSNRETRRPIKNDDIENYQEFFSKFLKIIPLSEYNQIYVFMSGQELHTLRLAFDDAGLKWGDYLIWEKQHFVLGRKDYNPAHEFIVYGWKGKHKFYGPTNSSTILKHDRNMASKLHPTMKPVSLMAELVQNGSKKDGIVYDAFAGSGSTFMACEQTERTCYGMEYGPLYVQVIIDRWEAATGRKATRLN